jgi:hypothetical protein
LCLDHAGPAAHKRVQGSPPHASCVLLDIAGAYRALVAAEHIVHEWADLLEDVALR